MSNITERAVAAIGRDGQDADWQLRPNEHAEGLPPDARALKRVLESEELKRLIAQFREADAAAIKAQANYKKIGSWGLWAATIATIVGAFFLLPAEPWLNDLTRTVFSVVQLCLLGIAFGMARWLAMKKPFNTWMQKRAEAELARVELFNQVVRAGEVVQGDDIPLLPLKLEYFRRYQLDVQQRYYQRRGKQHEDRSWRNNRLLTLSSGITILVLVLGMFSALEFLEAWGLISPDWLVPLPEFLRVPQINRIMLAMGVIASAFYGLGISLSLMDLDERNASRYQTTAENLEYLTNTNLAEARKAAAANDSQTVYNFVAKIQALISSEHQEWILLSARERALDPDKLRHVKGL
jgi:hypothetical protein